VPETICQGLTVIEMGSGCIAGSMSGMILADNGARVLKIESPSGDRLRNQHPSGFLVWNRGKESVVADLHTEEGRNHVRSLIAGSDVAIEGFSAGLVEEWGLSYEDLKALNPALVNCKIRGFSSQGPFANLKPYEGVVAAKAGLFSRGRFAFRPGPIYVNSPVASYGAAHMATAGILAALLAREKSGHGQDLEASLWQGLTPIDYFGLITYQNAVRSGRSTAKVAPTAVGVVASRFSPTGCSADGRWFITCTMLPHQGQSLVRALGLEHLLDDPKFKNVPYFDSVDDAEEYDSVIWERFRSLTAQEITERMLAQSDVAFEMVRSSEHALDHPQVIHNGEVIELIDSQVGPIQEVGPIAHFTSTPAVIKSSAPPLGDNQGPTTGPQALTSAESSPEHPLSGITIVEFGYFYAMPYGVTMAAALGARVIKLEDEHGDPMRRSFGEAETGSTKVTEGKESISLDMKSEEGRRIVHQIVEHADVFVLGFRPGVAERLGVDYETLRAINPRLVYVHAGGYGPDGPAAQRPMYAQTAAAIAGSYYRYAGYWLAPELSEGMDITEIRAILEPRIHALADGDSNAALGVLSAIVLGLFAQQRTGAGQFVSESMINGNLWCLSDEACRYPEKPPARLSDPDLRGLSATYRLYEAEGDSWIFLAATTEREWAALLEVIGEADWSDDPRFADADARANHDDELIDVLTDVFSSRPAAELEHTLSAKGVGCAEAYAGSTSEFAATTHGLLESGLTFQVDDPNFGRVVRYGAPVTFSDMTCRIAPGCRRGQHNDAILSELGYDSEAIAQLKKAGTVVD
jgi:crotonobetainyl-CoA:carnitine CoA-transferase CaiB-like acyl-CoA transferase